MKFCNNCGKELLDEAVICPGCGCAVKQGNNQILNTNTASRDLVKELSGKMQINGIIWIVIAVIQILLGIFVNWIFLIVGALNIVSAIMDIKYSKDVLTNPVGIVQKFKPLAGPIAVLVYNVVFGGIIGVAGSIYYLVAIRNFVLSNEAAFAQIEAGAIQ